MTIKQIEIDAIRTDGGTQMRESLQESVYLEYMEAYLAGADMPPVDVFFDGSTYWLADGFHRFHGAKHAELEMIPAKVHQGTQRDAILFAVGANCKHGLKRTNEDKRRSVMVMLQDEQWVKWSDRKIAEATGVHHDLVATVRKQLADSASSPEIKGEQQKRIGADGIERKVPAKQEKHKALPKAETKDADDTPEPPTAKEPSGGLTFEPSEWEQESVKDGLGVEVTGELRKPFELIAEIQQQRQKLTAIKSWLTQRINHAGGLVLAAAQQRIVTDIDNADRELKFAAPFCQCVYCQNKMPKVANCEACRGRGWLTKEVYESAPKGMKRGKH